MTMSSPVTPGRSGFLSEPPLSPGAAPPTSTPMTTRPPQNQPSIEAQVVRLGLMTPDQVATAMREEAETGRSFDEVVIGHGWVSAEDLARVREPDAAPAPPPPPAPAPAPAPPVAVVPDPPPVAVVPDPPPVAVVPDPEPEPVHTATAEIFVRLSNGERVAAGSFESESAAEQRARELMQALDGHGEWPRLEGRFIRPDAVVSIDVELGS
jgi:hypothetical protein